VNEVVDAFVERAVDLSRKNASVILSLLEFPENLPGDPEIMDIPEQCHKPLTEGLADGERHEHIFDRHLVDPSIRAEVLHRVLTENPTNERCPGHPLLIDSEEIDVLKQQVSITGHDIQALTAHPRK
jgi:hypothetical protein